MSYPVSAYPLTQMGEILIFYLSYLFPSEVKFIKDTKACDSTFMDIILILSCPKGWEKFQKREHVILTQ
jgi:hypothetical protein